MSPMIRREDYLHAVKTLKNFLQEAGQPSNPPVLPSSQIWQRPFQERHRDRQWKWHTWSDSPSSSAIWWDWQSLWISSKWDDNWSRKLFSKDKPYFSGRSARPFSHWRSAEHLIAYRPHFYGTWTSSTAVAATNRQWISGWQKSFSTTMAFHWLSSILFHCFGVSIRYYTGIVADFLCTWVARDSIAEPRKKKRNTTRKLACSDVTEDDRFFRKKTIRHARASRHYTRTHSQLRTSSLPLIPNPRPRRAPIILSHITLQNKLTCWFVHASQHEVPASTLSSGSYLIGPVALHVTLV